MKTYNYRFVEIDNIKCVDEKYAVIEFNGTALPLGAIFIDFCASRIFFKDIDEELSLWFWRFTICVDVAKYEESRKVIAFAQKLRNLITDNKSRVKRKIRNKYDTDDRIYVYDWWVDTLDIMIESARHVKFSKWVGIPTVQQVRKQKLG